MEPAAIGGLVTGGLNFLQSGIQGMENYMLGIEDRKYQRELNNQAQKNFETQMTFAKAQADQQVRQFEANRIGNLTKEYADAGLNPLLAAGMGQSKAGSVSMGGLPQKTGTDRSTANLISANEQMMKYGSMTAMAQVNKLNAEAHLANTQADDIEATRDNRIDNLISQTGLNEAKAKEAIEMSNKLKSDTAVNNALEKLVKANETTAHYEAAGQALKNKLLALDAAYYDVDKQKIYAEIDKLIADVEHLKTQDESIRNKVIQGWFDRTIGKLIKW